MYQSSIVPVRVFTVLALMFAWELPAAADMGYDDPNSRYEAARSRCEGMADNEKAQCLKQAEEIRKSEDPGRGHKAERQQYNEQYRMDKKKCDAMELGPDRDNCMEQLKTKYEHN